MLKSEFEKLAEKENCYIGIGITEKGETVSSFPIPWQMTSNAMNMKLPDIFISKEDIFDEQVMSMIKKCKVVGCYIFVPLDSYDFLSEFIELMDLNILCGENIENLDFLPNLQKLKMLYLEDVKVENIDILIEMRQREEDIFKRAMNCVGLYNCEIEDISAFGGDYPKFVEFNVWNSKKRNERERWKCIKALESLYMDIGAVAK